MPVGRTQLLVRDPGNNAHIGPREFEELIFFGSMPDNQQLLTRSIARLNRLIHVLIGHQARHQQKVVPRSREFLQTRDRFFHAGCTPGVRRENNGYIFAVHPRNTFLNGGRVRHVMFRPRRRALIPEPQQRVYHP